MGLEGCEEGGGGVVVVGFWGGGGGGGGGEGDGEVGFEAFGGDCYEEGEEGGGGEEGAELGVEVRGGGDAGLHGCFVVDGGVVLVR